MKSDSSLLSNMLRNSLLKEDVGAQQMDACKENVIDTISNYSIDFAIGTYIRANSEDQEFNEKVDAFTNSYYELIKYLEKEGYIRINGVQVSRVLNK